MTETPQALARWFPLVPRARPICAPLDQRIDDVTHRAHHAKNPTEAAAALNLTALIASDVGAWDLATDMCWQQFYAFAGRAPLDSVNAGLAMEPIINLARLAIRKGDGDRAHQILDQTLTAASEAAVVTVDGNILDFAGLTTTAESRHAARERLWIATLSDGTRALIRAGRWTRALQAVKRRNGIGDRLLDGRQTAIIAHYTAGDLTSAITMIAQTAATAPWEKALAMYLETCCAVVSGTANAKGCGSLMQQVLQLKLPAEQRLFQTRLGLSILELACLIDFDTELLVKELGNVALQTGDAYAARDLVNDQNFMILDQGATLPVLRKLTSESRLDVKAVPNTQRRRLNLAFDSGLVRLCRVIDETKIP